MTIMQKQKSVSKTISVESLPTHADFWSNLYKLRNDQSETQSSRDIFMEHFSSSGTPLSDEAIDHISKAITIDEVSSIIASSPNRSAAGIDGISNEFYKLSHPSFHEHLTVVLNEFYSNPSSLPTWIATSCISLLHKKGPTDDPANYRPISLLPTLWKLLSNILTQRLNLYMKQLIMAEQVGFIKGRNIEVPLHIIDSIMKQASSTFSIAVDFEKAFDSLNHDYLFLVLRHFKLPDKFINLIAKFLSLGKSCIRTNGVFSNSFFVERGVRQGDPLSGLLFVLALEPLLCALHITLE